MYHGAKLLMRKNEKSGKINKTRVIFNEFCYFYWKFSDAVLLMHAFILYYIILYYNIMRQNIIFILLLISFLRRVAL